MIAWIGVVVAVTAIKVEHRRDLNDNFSLHQTESHQASRLLAQSAPRLSGDTEEVVIASRTGPVTAPAARARFGALLARLARLPHVTEIQSPYGPHGSSQIARDRRIAFADVTFDLAANLISGAEERAFVRTVRSASAPGIEFEDQGQVAEATVNNDDTHSLIVGFVAAGFVLFVVFGSLARDGAAAADRRRLARLRDRGHRPALPTRPRWPRSRAELAALMGLGVGVDYALFIVTRYRQARLRGIRARRRRSRRSTPRDEQ